MRRRPGGSGRSRPGRTTPSTRPRRTARFPFSYSSRRAPNSFALYVGAGDTSAVEPVILRTDRLLLRPFTSSDAEAVYLACQDPDIQFYTPAPSPYRRADAETFVNESAPMGWSTDTEYIFGAFRDDDGSFVGTYLLTRRDQGVYEI